MRSVITKRLRNLHHLLVLKQFVSISGFDLHESMFDISHIRNEKEKEEYQQVSESNGAKCKFPLKN